MLSLQDGRPELESVNEGQEAKFGLKQKLHVDEVLQAIG